MFGLPSLRLRGFYLAVSTLAAQFFVQWALTKFGWFSNDNPSRRDRRARRSTVGGIAFDYAGRAATLFSLTHRWRCSRFCTARLLRTQTGHHFIAVRDNELAARVIGVPVLRTKLLAFARVVVHRRRGGRAVGASLYLRTVEPRGLQPRPVRSRSCSS